MTTPAIIGYVCADCMNTSAKAFCHYCNDYKNLIPITKNILEMLEPVDDEMGFCDTCGVGYDVGSRDGRCGDCGECRNHCDH